MLYDPEKHHRRSIRLKGHDYAGGGTYFVTLCAHREAGNIFADAAAKEILSRIWEEIALEAEGGVEKGRVRAGLVSAPSAPSFPQEGAHEALPYIIMPDHFHALLRIRKGEKALGDFICAFKSRTTHEYIQGVNAGKFPPFKKKIWHRNYYEMMVRSAEAEEKIAEYIRMNPWKCVQNLGNGLRGIGNPALWNAEKLGVLCSRNAPHVGRLPEAEVYFGGWHSPKEKEIFDWLLQHGKRIIACPAWGIGAKDVSPFLEALQENRMLILEMDTGENFFAPATLAAAEQRNRFVIENADALFTPHVTPGGMLDRLLKGAGKR
ncbi:transposase [Pontiellaceae bacterium B12227]|nr:transposase [Pontiellaceae bacterium B12227]